jgi:hypothetical protein
MPCQRWQGTNCHRACGLSLQGNASDRPGGSPSFGKVLRPTAAAGGGLVITRRKRTSFNEVQAELLLWTKGEYIDEAKGKGLRFNQSVSSWLSSTNWRQPVSPAAPSFSFHSQSTRSFWEREPTLRLRRRRHRMAKVMLVRFGCENDISKKLRSRLA